MQLYRRQSICQRPPPPEKGNYRTNIILVHLQTGWCAREREFAANHSPGPTFEGRITNALPSTLVYGKKAAISGWDGK